MVVYLSPRTTARDDDKESWIVYRRWRILGDSQVDSSLECCPSYSPSSLIRRDHRRYGGSREWSRSDRGVSSIFALERVEVDGIGSQIHDMQES